MISVQNWLAFLRQSDALIGIPLVLGGVALMLMGWRMWKVCVMLSFALIGLGVGSALAARNEHVWIYGVASGVVLGFVSLKSAKFAVAALGGAIGAAVVLYLLEQMRISGQALWLSVGVVFIGASAVAYIHKRVVVIGVTSVLGAALLLSGLTAFAMASPHLYGTITSLTNTSVIVGPFMLLVPTVVSCFYQISDVHRNQAEL